MKPVGAWYAAPKRARAESQHTRDFFAPPQADEAVSQRAIAHLDQTAKSLLQEAFSLSPPLQRLCRNSGVWGGTAGPPKKHEGLLK